MIQGQFCLIDTLVTFITDNPSSFVHCSYFLSISLVHLDYNRRSMFCQEVLQKIKIFFFMPYNMTILVHLRGLNRGLPIQLAILHHITETMSLYPANFNLETLHHFFLLASLYILIITYLSGLVKHFFQNLAGKIFSKNF